MRTWFAEKKKNIAEIYQKKVGEESKSTEEEKKKADTQEREELDKVITRVKSKA